MIEADPKVVAFCELPLTISIAGRERAVDFWVQLADGEEELLCVWKRPEAIDPPVWQSMLVRGVGDAELQAADVWTSNWERMLPVLIATRGLVTTAIRDAVLCKCEQPQQLSVLERLGVTPDQMVLRGAVIELLHKGLLQANGLRTAPLSQLTQFVSAR